MTVEKEAVEDFLSVNIKFNEIYFYWQTNVDKIELFLFKIMPMSVHYSIIKLNN